MGEEQDGRMSVVAKEGEVPESWLGIMMLRNTSVCH